MACCWVSTFGASRRQRNHDNDGTTHRTIRHRRRRRLSESSNNRQPPQQAQQKRILYIVTSMREFDIGIRATQKGYNRFSKTIAPVVSEGIHSMVATGFEVDLVFICHYPLTDSRRAELRAGLPLSVGLQVWDEATPLSYDYDYSSQRIAPVTRGLARQHRYVIKDYYEQYDAFVCFEDDVLIKGAHVQHFLDLTNDLYKLRADAWTDYADPAPTPEAALSFFYGEMTEAQIARLIPGFIRVEAALPNFQPPLRRNKERIPVDHDWNATRTNLHINPAVCCHVSAATTNEQIPLAPTADQLYFWETHLEALGVRKLPDRAAWDWVLQQAGNVDEFYAEARYVVGDYWSGRRDNADGQQQQQQGKQQRPDRTLGKYLNNQGGWMLTRRQILELHTMWCRDNFLPPYNEPLYPADGLDKRTVEYWSGGIQIVGVKACNMQRIITLDPADFSKHLLYHTSNNKQREVTVLPRFSSGSVDEFWGQVNAVRKNAERQMQKEMAATEY